MMTGLLASQNVRCSEQRIGASLHRVNPGYHAKRQRSAARIYNPSLYRANYFGEKIHVDQNEKFGLTHVCAIDGFSGKIVGYVIMPVKNNVTIYRHLYM